MVKTDSQADKRSTREHKDRRLQIIRDAKSKKCADCKKRHPYWRMQFDHLPGSKKVAPISMMRYASLVKLMAEIEKCEVVCANCHADRTHARVPRTRLTAP